MLLVAPLGLEFVLAATRLGTRYLGASDDKLTSSRGTCRANRLTTSTGLSNIGSAKVAISGLISCCDEVGDKRFFCLPAGDANGTARGLTGEVFSTGVIQTTSESSVSSELPMLITSAVLVERALEDVAEEAFATEICELFDGDARFCDDDVDSLKGEKGCEPSFGVGIENVEGAACLDRYAFRKSTFALGRSGIHA